MSIDLYTLLTMRLLHSTLLLSSLLAVNGAAVALPHEAGIDARSNCSPQYRNTPQIFEVNHLPPLPLYIFFPLSPHANYLRCELFTSSIASSSASAAASPTSSSTSAPRAASAASSTATPRPLSRSQSLSSSRICPPGKSLIARLVMRRWMQQMEQLVSPPSG